MRVDKNKAHPVPTPQFRNEIEYLPPAVFEIDIMQPPEFAIEGGKPPSDKPV